MVLLSLVAKLALQESRESHALLLVSNYDTKVGRDKRALIQIESINVESLEELYAKYGDSFKSNIKDLMALSKPEPLNDYHVVINFIFNRDSNAPGPMCKQSFIGYPRNTPPFLTIDQAILRINMGDYNI
jgi:hypothetical protein